MFVNQQRGMEKSNGNQRLAMCKLRSENWYFEGRKGYYSKDRLDGACIASF